MKQKKIQGFTLLELLIVVAIIGILASIVLVALSSAQDSAYESRAKGELRALQSAVQLYFLDNDSYPEDGEWDFPASMEEYLPSGDEIEGAWPGSIYTWESWSPSDLSHAPYEHVYQISIRFCPQGGSLDDCSFPVADWADNFDQNSAFFYCIDGPCRSHKDEPMTHPGFCMNCSEEEPPYGF